MTVSQPDITINILPAELEVGNAPHRVLLVGQKVAAGSAASGALITDIQNDNSEDALFGAHSQLAAMVRNFKKINKVTRVDAIALSDNGSGVAAGGVCAFSGTATAAGTLYVSVGSEYNHKYAVPVAIGDTASALGAALVALIAADGDAPVSGVNTTGSVALTSLNKGTEFNNIPLKVDGSVAGITVALTAFTSGATNPSLTGLFDVIDDIRYQTIVYPGTWTLATLSDLTEARFNATNQILDGIGIVCVVDTYANLNTLGSGLNLKTITMLANQLVSRTALKGGAIVEMPWVIAAEFAAIRALRLTDEANIAQYIVSTIGGRDSFGGSAIASLPYFNTPFFYLPLIAPGDAFTRSEIETLLTNGLSVISNNVTGTQIIAGEVATLYKTDVAGNPDPSFKFLEYVDTALQCREYFWNNLRRRFSQCRLTEGDLIPNRSMANRQSIESYLDSLYDDLSGVDYVLTQAGETALKYFKDNRTVTLDMVNGKVTVTMKVPIVVQLRTILATLQLSFSTET